MHEVRPKAQASALIVTYLGCTYLIPIIYNSTFLAKLLAVKLKNYTGAQAQELSFQIWRTISYAMGKYLFL